MTDATMSRSEEFGSVGEFVWDGTDQDVGS